MSIDRSLRECDCPAYVSRCAHAGELRLWLITTEDGLAELERRGGRCGHCSLPPPPPGLRAEIHGPGVLDRAGPECACYVELLVPEDGGWRNRIREGDDLEAMFEMAVERLVAAADAEDEQ